MAWGDNATPNTWIEYFLTDTTIRNVVENHKSDCWRIHRRWARDDAGHTLMLHMFVDESSENAIRESIEKDKYLINLCGNDLIEKHFENSQKIK